MSQIPKRFWTVTGLPITPETHLLFGSYAGGAAVIGVVQLREGLMVNYADGSANLFVPIPDGGSLVARPDGLLHVVPPLDLGGTVIGLEERPDGSVRIVP